MKLKSLIAIAGVACAAVSYGDTTSVATGNTLCRIKFTTSEKEVLIGLPLVDVGGTEQTINATNYISTVGLPSGTTLFGKDSVSGKWSSWEISENAWAQLTTVADDSKYVAGDNASFARGSAVRLSFPSKPATTQAVYLYGQVANASTTGDIATTATRSPDAPTYTPLSNINAAEIAIANLPINGQVKGDKIAVLSNPETGIGLTEYRWDGSNWKLSSGSIEESSPFPAGLVVGGGSSVTASKTFMPGEGFFYITTTNGTTTAATFNWGN